MNWPALFQALTAVALGGIIGFATAFFVERQRQATARSNQLRQAYSRWLALQTMTSLDLELLAQLTEQISERESSFLEVITDDLKLVRPHILSLTELGHEILSLEKNDDLREVVNSATETATRIFVGANAIVRAHQRHAFFVDKVTSLQAQLNQMRSDHPEYSNVSATLASFREDLAQRYDKHLRGSHEQYENIVRLNTEQVKLVHEITEKLASQLRS
jgi:gas vesicle protein